MQLGSGLLVACTVACVEQWGGYLGGFGLTDAQGFPEVGVHCVVGLALSLGRLDPVGDHLNREPRE